MVMFQILLNGAEPRDAGTTQLSSPVCRSGGQQDPLSICVAYGLCFVFASEKSFFVKSYDFVLCCCRTT